MTTTVNGFLVLPVSYSATATHYLYARKHAGSKKQSSSSWPDDRTLFLVNVPPDATEREITLFFKSFGLLERVSFDLDATDPQNQDLVVSSDSESEAEADADVAGEVAADGGEPPKKKRKTNKLQPPTVVPLPTTPLRTFRKSGRTAHVVFLDSSSLDRFLAASHTKPRSWPVDSEAPSGLDHYLALYDSLRPPLDIVRAHADTSIELYDFEVAKSKHKSKYRKGEAIVDDDGFTLVTRGGAYGQTLGGGISVATKSFQETGQTSRRHQKKKDKDKDGFYGFQKAEKQRTELLNLKKNFEEDKAKIEKLKASRKFQPY